MASHYQPILYKKKSSFTHLMPFISFIAVGLIYSLILYLTVTRDTRFDYSSFYSGAYALSLGKNPYQPLITHYFSIAQHLSLNVNPPIVLMLFVPLSKLHYFTSFALWSLLSCLLGWIAASIACSLVFPASFSKQHRRALYVMYFASYPALINTAIGQLGMLIAGFVMLGYYFYLRKNDGLAAFFWGSIIAMKYFPGLLLLYALQQRRYGVVVRASIVVIILSFIPYWIYGVEIYLHYLDLLSRLNWFGDNWNASIQGFLFRLLFKPHPLRIAFEIKCLCFLCIIAMLIGFVRVLNSKTRIQQPHHAFSLTLVLMLLMSPLGWMYYFPLLILPLCLTGLKACSMPKHQTNIALWSLCLFLINFPISYVRAQKMHTLLATLSIHSFYYYGLWLLIYLILKTQDNNSHPSSEIALLHESQRLVWPIQTILGFGLFITSIYFIDRLMH